MYVRKSKGLQRALREACYRSRSEQERIVTAVKGNCEKLLTETLVSANIFDRKRCYRKATVHLSYVVIKKAT